MTLTWSKRIIIHLRQAAERHPVLLQAAVWCAMLSLMVGAGSMAAALGFIQSFSTACGGEEGMVRVAFEGPREAVCVPGMVLRWTWSNLDCCVPFVFAALLVAASALAIRAMGLWNHNS
ncbi:hypothetical protein Sjap_012790 [Stephania japonica]|uniref:Uncharacterized protein n=1 Tax=Stephania japonica TaxID=461633 RepID=A0AAP0NXZ9_9MAGN